MTKVSPLLWRWLALSLCLLAAGCKNNERIGKGEADFQLQAQSDETATPADAPAETR